MPNVLGRSLGKGDKLHREELVSELPDPKLSRLTLSSIDSTSTPYVTPRMTFAAVLKVPPISTGDKKCN